MSDFASLFLKIDSTGAVTASKNLDDLAAKGDKAEQSTKKVSTASSALTDQLKKMAVAAAAAFSAWKLLDMARDAALAAARYETLGVAMSVVGNNAGYTRRQLNEFEMSLRKTGIAMTESRAVITRMAQAQLDLTKSSQLARVAQDAAVIGNINSSEAFERMIHGIQSAQVEVLRGIGLNVNFENSYKKLAKELGTTSANLTESEKMQARFNVVMEAGAGIAGTYEGAMTTAGKQLLSMQRYSDDLKVKLGSVFNDLLIAGVTTMTGALKDANTEADRLGQNQKLQAWSKDVAYAVAVMADSLVLPFKVINTGLETLATNAMIVSRGFMAMLSAQRFDFKGAKENLDEIGFLLDALADRQGERWDNGGMAFQKALDDMYAAREKNAAKEKATAEALEQQRITAHGAAMKAAAEQAAADKRAAEALALEELELKSVISYKEYKAQAAKREREQLDELIRKTTEYNAAVLATLPERELALARLTIEYMKHAKAIEAMRLAGEISGPMAENDQGALWEKFEKDKAALDETSAASRDLLKEIEAIDGYTFEGQSFGNEIADGVNNAVISMQSLFQMMERQGELEEEIAEKRKRLAEANDISPAERLKAIKQIEKAEEDSQKSQVSGYRQLAGTVSQLFKEQSKERKALHNLEKGLAAIELAMNLKNVAAEIMGMMTKTSAHTASTQIENTNNVSKAATGGLASIMAQGSAGPYIGFALMAAMAALVASTFSSFGQSSPGGAAPTVTGLTGSVFGDPTATSESTTKVLDLLKDNHAEEYHELRGINDGVRSLNDSIMGLVNNIVRNGGKFNASAFGLEMGDTTGKLRGLFDQGRDFIEWTQSINPSQQFEKFLIDPLSIGVTKWATEFGSKMINSVMGGDVYQYQTRGGVILPTSSIGAIRGGDVQGRNFATVRTEIDGGLFGDDDNSEQTFYAKMSAEVNLMFNKVLDNMANSVFALGEAFGMSEEAINSTVFKLGAINLQGLNGEQINKRLTEYFSAVGDRAIDALLGPIIDQYRQVGEGGMETAARLAIDMAIVRNSLEMVGQTIGNEFSPALLEATESIVALAGGLENFTDISSTYYDKFFTEAEKQANLEAGLNSAFGGLGYELPGTREAFRAIVEGLDLMTESGRNSYVALLQLSGIADQYYSTLEDRQEEQRDLMLSLARSNVSTLSSAVNALSNAREQMTGISFSQALSGLVGINSAVGGGDFESLQGMDRYLNVLTGLGTDNYSTAEDYNADRGRARLAIADLESTAGTQLSAQERMVEVLEDVNAEIAELRAELRAANYAIARNTGDQTTILEDWNANGMPDVRVE